MKASPELRLKTKYVIICCMFCFLSLAVGVKAQEAADIVDVEQGDKAVNTLPWLGLLLFGCFLLAGKYAYTQLWSKKAISAKEALQLHEARQRILLRLAELDEKYESGQIDEQSYIRERSQRKQQLVELTLLCKNMESKTLKVKN